ncbi:GTP cyclohydrolase, FolE2/MptA family [Candidatus Altiarchaeota archaeon]
MKGKLETQENRPRVEEELESAGITNLRTYVETQWKGRSYRFVPEIEITVDLPAEKKGVHMSRLVESITEILEEETLESHRSIEELERKILERLEKKHPHRKSRISMKTQLVVHRKTPVTKKTSMETHDIEVEVIKQNGEYRKLLRVKVTGNTVCPHALKNNDGKTHIQRADATLEVDTGYDNNIELEDMISTVEGCFCSPVYTLLKTEDENEVIQKLYANPMFVEDVCRKIIHETKKRYKKSGIKATVISQESIHRHNVKAEAVAKT